MSKENTALAIFNPELDELNAKKALYNLTVNAEIKVSDMVNSIINVKGFALTEAEVTNRETGELETRERVVVIDNEGKTYHSVASGIVNSFKNIAKVFGDTRGDTRNEFVTVEPVLPVKVIRKETPKGNTYICVIE